MDGFITADVIIALGIGLGLWCISAVARACLPADHWFNSVFSGRNGSGSGGDWGDGGGDGGD